jgi:hypothetical protein
VATNTTWPGDGIWRPGLVCLKGGDLNAEVAALRARYSGLEVEAVELGVLLGRSYFDGKQIVSVAAAGRGRLKDAG